MKALLLSAGKGMRFQPQTLKYSKMVLPFLNIPIIGYPLKFLEDLNVQSVVINTHYLSKQVEEEVLKLQPRIQKVHFSFEEKLLGGAGTLRKNKSLFGDEHLIYLNGDSIFLGSEFFLEMKKQHKNDRALITFLVIPDNSKKDIWASSEGWLSLKQEKNLKSYFFPGLALFSPECLSLLREEDTNIFKSIVQRFPNRCRVYVHKNLDFFEVGYVSDYLKSTQKGLDELFKNELKGSQLKNVFSRYNQKIQLKQIEEKHKILIGDSVQGVENIRVKGFAVIGKDCHFNQSVLVEKSVIGNGQVISQEHLFQNLFI